MSLVGGGGRWRVYGPLCPFQGVLHVCACGVWLCGVCVAPVFWWAYVCGVEVTSTARHVELIFAHVGGDRRAERLPVGVERLDEVSADAGALRLAPGRVYSRIWVSHDEVDERGDLLGRATLE